MMDTERWLFYPEDGSPPQEVEDVEPPDLTDPHMVVSTAEVMAWIERMRAAYPASKTATGLTGLLHVFLLQRARKIAPPE